MPCWNVEERDGIVVAAHNNPPMNYLVSEGTAELADLVESWRRPEVRVVVITGAPKDKYITHYSVEELVKLGDDPIGSDSSPAGSSSGITRCSVRSPISTSPSSPR